MESLLNCYPEIAAEFHPNNIGLDPALITSKSNRRVWWICSVDNSHVWQTSVYNRTINSTGCPYCANQLVSNTNNLLIQYPEIAKEWNIERNEGLTPSDVLPKTNKKYYWNCLKGHIYESSPNARLRGRGCGFCNGKKVDNTNSLATLYPAIAQTWHPTKNGNLTPETVTPKSSKIVYWLCEVGHEWEAVISSRTNNRGCSCCSGRYPTKENNLVVLYPDIATEWHPTKNRLKPDEIGPGSEKKVWWLCKDGHEWEAVVYSRTGKRQNGCPYCSNRAVSSTNNLAVLFPELVKEWDYNKNTITPDQVVPGSNERYWWKCLNNSEHEWSAIVYSRTLSETGCPYCSMSNTKLERFVAEKLHKLKYNKRHLNKSNYQPDFKLSDNLYLNIDGLYWHSEVYKDNDYHLEMRKAYESENKRIIQIYEDEVYEKWDIVNNLIKYSLGQITNKISARDCIITKVNKLDAHEFCKANHLMGAYDIASHFGLYYQNELVSLLSVRHEDNSITIERFCNKLNNVVRGSFNKLLAHVIKSYNPITVITFCDLRYATGNTYKLAGFKLAGVTQGWGWTDRFNRYNRLYCKASNGKSETENAKEQGLIRIYDAGQAKYVLNRENKDL